MDISEIRRKQTRSQEEVSPECSSISDDDANSLHIDRNSEAFTQNDDTDSVNRSTYMCPDCGIPVTVEEHRIQCEVFTEWFQDKCQVVSNSLYETRMDETNQISWYCNHCRRGAKVMTGNIMRINERQNKMETRLNEIEKKAKKITEEPRSEPKLTKEIEDMIEEKVNEGISSYREREARTTNVIIHNMPESKKETPTERKADDEEYVLGIAKQIHADNIQIKNIIRLGKKTDDPRPTKVILQTVTQKRK